MMSARKRKTPVPSAPAQLLVLCIDLVLESGHYFRQLVCTADDSEPVVVELCILDRHRDIVLCALYVAVGAEQPSGDGV